MAPDKSNFEIKFNEHSNIVLKSWIWIMIFSIAFAWVESAVVVYLRTIYFDGDRRQQRFRPMRKQWKKLRSKPICLRRCGNIL